MSLNDEIQKNKNRVIRRAFIKRRLAATGKFEADWQDISKDVKKWGQIRATSNDVRRDKFKFGNVRMILANDAGQYSDEDNDNSLWFGFASRQRSLLKIEVGFLNQSLSADGIWTSTEFPTNGSGTLSTAFTGVLTGDMFTTQKNEILMTVKPLVEIFRQYPARLLDGWTSTGLSASQFIEMMRDHTDGAGEFIFRPFFGDTTANWVINSTSVIYSNLNTKSAADIIDKNCWQVVEKLAEAEQFIPYVTRAGVFTFRSISDITTTVAFEFHGQGSTDRTYGKTIKEIQSFGKAHSDYYSRVEVKFSDEDTETSYEVVEATMTVAGNNDVWNLGHRTLQIQNTWIPNTATANSIAATVFNEVSQIKNKIQFTASLVPQLEILDRSSITFDSGAFRAESLWDVNNWGDSTGAADIGGVLVWDKQPFSSINLRDTEFGSLNITLDLDKLETKVTAREL